jgi:hypothetical protein
MLVDLLTVYYDDESLMNTFKSEKSNFDFKYMKSGLDSSEYDIFALS